MIFNRNKKQFPPPANQTCKHQDHDVLEDVLAVENVDEEATNRENATDIGSDIEEGVDGVCPPIL